MLVWRICKAARMFARVCACWSEESVKLPECLHESILPEARIVSAFNVVLCCKVRVPSPRASISRDNKSRTYTRKSSVHAPVSADGARFPASSILSFWRQSIAIRTFVALTSSVGPNQVHRAAATSVWRDSESRRLIHSSSSR